MLFAASAVVGAILIAFVSQPAEFINSATFHFARDVAYSVVNIYVIKMAGVFMTSTSIVAIYTCFAPRWLAVLGYVLALVLLFGSYHFRWSFALSCFQCGYSLSAFIFCWKTCPSVAHARWQRALSNASFCEKASSNEASILIDVII
jgi:hypothetical protein